jgi:UDP-arabinose 4-epimerase
MTASGSAGSAVLVTGGAGYIGSHTCKLLSQAGCLPIAYDNLSVGNHFAARFGPLVVGDIADNEQVGDTIKKYNVSSVIHFAASAYVGESITAPRKYFENNLCKAIKLLNCLLDHGVNTFVFSSTCATYGIPDRLPINEDQPQSPINPYGDSKLAIEKVLRWYGDAYGLRSVALRYFNAAGADPEGEIGECHAEETHLIPLAIRATFPDGQPLSIFGTDYPTPDGTAVRDYIHVMDLADAHIKALRFLSGARQAASRQQGCSAAFNLGTGRGSSIKDVLAAIERVTGRPVQKQERPRREGDPAMLVADPSRARAELQWKAEHSSLQEIVSTAWQWSLKNDFADPLSWISIPGAVSAGLSSPIPEPDAPLSR